MTQEEIEVFKNKITETIMPAAEKMTEEQIHDLIRNVEKENSELPSGFGDMLLEQILIMKYNQQEKIN